MAEFAYFRESDYEALRGFLVELNRDSRDHINWNWARLEWMYEHPEFDKSGAQTMGLWWEAGKVVGAALYDMYYGEGFCAVLPGHEALYPEVLCYAREHLKDDSGFGLAIEDGDYASITAAEAQGFRRAEQTETILGINLEERKEAALPAGFRFYELNPAKESEEFAWLLWQGFDHGSDREEFLREDDRRIQARPHLRPELSLAVQNDRGENAAYVCLWYDEAADYAYLEPVCTVPAFRGKGLAKAAISEALNRGRALGAGRAYVISDMDFYKHLGFRQEKHFTFYWYANAAE